MELNVWVPLESLAVLLEKIESNDPVATVVPLERGTLARANVKDRVRGREVTDGGRRLIQLLRGVSTTAYVMRRLQLRVDAGLGFEQPVDVALDELEAATLVSQKSSSVTDYRNASTLTLEVIPQV